MFRSKDRELWTRNINKRSKLIRYSEKDENNYLASLLLLYAEFAEGLELEKKASTRQGVMARGWHPISLHRATQTTEKPRD